LWGMSNIAAPFALGYYRKDRLVSLLQIGLGFGTIAASLFTDYRAYNSARSGGHSRAPRTLKRTAKKRKKA